MSPKRVTPWGVLSPTIGYLDRDRTSLQLILIPPPPPPSPAGAEADEVSDGDVTIGGGDGSGNSGCYSAELMSHESSDQMVRVVEMNDGVLQTTLMTSHDVKAMDRSLCGVQEGEEGGGGLIFASFIFIVLLVFLPLTFFFGLTFNVAYGVVA